MKAWTTVRKRLRHPVVGDLELAYEAFELPADPGLTMFAYTAEPASVSEERLALLASWSASTADAPPTATDASSRSGAPPSYASRISRPNTSRVWQ